MRRSSVQWGGGIPAGLFFVVGVLFSFRLLNSKSWALSRLQGRQQHPQVQRHSRTAPAQSQKTALSWAASHGSVDAVRELLQAPGRWGVLSAEVRGSGGGDYAYSLASRMTVTSIGFAWWFNHLPGQSESGRCAGNVGLEFRACVVASRHGCAVRLLL